MHVDLYIDHRGGDPYARFVLLLFRLPAMLLTGFAPFIGQHRLFCDYEGKRYRVTGASRLGDVWLVADLERGHGHDERVDVELCERWGAEA